MSDGNDPRSVKWNNIGCLGIVLVICATIVLLNIFGK
jgi:hypothetical protein